MTREEYFKNSKVRDEQGNLLVCYHGTNAHFKSFNNACLMWFAQDEFYTDNFGPNKIKAYLNITHPLYIEDIDYLFASEDEDEWNNPKNHIKYKNSRGYDDEVVVSNIVLTMANDLKIDIHELIDLWSDYANSGCIYEVTRTPEFADILERQGFDGVITMESGNPTFGVVNPNQIKYIDNNNPTSSDRMDEDMNNIEQEILNVLRDLGFECFHLQGGWKDEDGNDIDDSYWEDNDEPQDGWWYVDEPYYLCKNNSNQVSFSWRVDESQKIFTIVGIYGNYKNSTKGFATRTLDVCLKLIPSDWTIYVENNINNPYWNHIKSKYPQYNWRDVYESLNESKQDIERFRQWAGDELADRFFKQKAKIRAPWNDITYIMKHYGGREDFEKDVKWYEDNPSRREAEVKGKQGAEKIYEDNNWLVLDIQTYEASVLYGKHTSWCVTGNNSYDGKTDFDMHTNTSKLIFYIPKKGSPAYWHGKYALEFGGMHNWTLFNDADFVEVGEGEYYEMAEGDVWSAQDCGGKHPNFPKIEGLPDINKAYQDLANEQGYEKPLILEEVEQQEDSKGNKLSKEQVEFFRDSKIRIGGKLALCYHGTSDKFDDETFASPINWFTLSSDYARGYANAFSDNGYTYQCYLNCKKPFNVGLTDGRLFELLPIKPFKLTKQAQDIFRRLNMSEQEIKEFLLRVNRDRYVSSDQDEYSTKIHHVVRLKSFKNLLISRGYDGIIAKEENNKTTIGVFNPSDIKEIHNTNPTNSTNINENFAKLKEGISNLDAFLKLK